MTSAKNLKLFSSLILVKGIKLLEVLNWWTFLEIPLYDFIHVQVYGSSSGANIKLTVCIEDHKFSPKNYWYVHMACSTDSSTT